jgi:hypothetical protein
VTWAPVGKPVLRPHEYIRGGTVKLLTLLRPATGEVRAKGVTNATNAVLDPWLQAELTAVLATLPPVTTPEEERPPLARWVTWLGHQPRDPLPPLRLLLLWDNLAGHLSWAIVRWLLHHGVMPLYTPLSGSWLNMAESVQRILVRRALEGHHPQSQDDLIAWLATPSQAGTPIQPPSSGTASATNVASAPDNVAWAAPRPPRPSLNYLRRDPLVGHVAFDWGSSRRVH